MARHARPSSPGSCLLEASSKLLPFGVAAATDTDCDATGGMAVQGTAALNPPPKEEDLAALAARVPWAAKFASANLDAPLWAGDMGKVCHKQDVDVLLQEIAKLTDSDPLSVRGNEFTSSWHNQEATELPAGACVAGDMTEDWGEAIAFTSSGGSQADLGVSRTLGSQDVLAAALN